MTSLGSRTVPDALSFMLKKRRIESFDMRLRGVPTAIGALEGAIATGSDAEPRESFYYARLLQRRD
jgi:hypothetical protein